MQFEWDEAKAESNFRKHGVRFSTAVRAFLDPFAISEQDRIEDGEFRRQTLGLVDGSLLLLVAHSDREEDGIEIVRIISAREATPRRRSIMARIVRYTLDFDNPPTLTEEQKAELEALKARPDSEIDTSDIPELDENFWKNAVRNPYFKPIKKQLTLRLDSDLIAWFKRRSKQGRGYQTRINEALREYVTEQEKKAG